MLSASTAAGSDNADDIDQAVQIRPIRPQDAAAVDAFVRSLSPQSRQRRFHVGIRGLPPALLDRFTRPLPGLEFAVVAMATFDGMELCVGEARYALDGEGGSEREFALVVADGWQRRGLGRRLLCSLMRQAIAGGVSLLVGDVLRDNGPMLTLVDSMGFARRRHPADPGLIRVQRALQLEPMPSPADICAQASPGTDRFSRDSATHAA